MAARSVWIGMLMSHWPQASQRSGEPTTTGVWRLFGTSDGTQFVTRGGCVRRLRQEHNGTEHAQRSGSGGRACIPVNSRVAGLSGSPRVTPVQPKRLSRVNGQVQEGSACARTLAAC